jgi:hypothetical protein
MSQWLMEKGSEFFETHTSRRGFLVRAAVAGSALAVGPLRFLLRPGTAYAAVCRCANSSCNCASGCCDGYTEFCCVMYGSNSCPSGSYPAGWWKADGTGFCSADRRAPRYYIDCNQLPGVGCGCRCGGNCNNRKSCCNVFRYGQCHQEIRGVTAINCRIVTCTPPWVFDSACTTSSATDNATGNHNSACLQAPPPPPPPPPPPARKTMAYGGWYLRNSNTGGLGEVGFGYGDPGDIPIMGDWNGDGVKTPGVVRGNWWFLCSTTNGTPDIAFQYGDPGDIPIVGDWNGDGTDTPGVVRGNWWFLRNSNTSGFADIAFQYGDVGDKPIVGDWNGDGTDTPGIVRGNWWFLRNSNTGGVGEIGFQYGDPADVPLAGDWNGDGIDTPGIAR